jgi:hypothetical protein
MVQQIQNTQDIEIKIKNMKWIKLGTWLEFIIDIITFGTGEMIALWIAKTFFNSNKCYCCERKQWLNRLTNPEFDGDCDRIKL